MNAVQRATRAWRGAPPDWVLVLAGACDARSQAEVARRLSYSPSVVNQVLGGSYRGDLAAVEAAVRGVLMGAVVDCPVFGEISRDQCLRNQRLPRGATGDPARRALRAACPGCEHRLGGAEGRGQTAEDRDR